jgi:hypothetical protein
VEPIVYACARHYPEGSWAARPRSPLSQYLKIRSAWVNKNQSQYAVTTIKIAEKTNLESRSCIIGGNSKCLAAIKKQGRRAEYDAGGLCHAGSG